MIDLDPQAAGVLSANLAAPAAYAVFAAVALAGFARARERALWPLFFLGLVWLPPVIDPQAWPQEPWLVIGGALPSGNPSGKAQFVPLACLLGALAFARARPKFVFTPADGAVAAFCLWPLAQAALLGGAAFPALISTVFLIYTWGALWMLGRLYLRDRAGLEAFATSLCIATVALLPLIVVEQASAHRVHEWLYGPQPFARIGQDRWIGNRPLLFFEDGNQYGLWLACAALCATWLWKIGPRPEKAALAAVLLACALASQSAGAIILLLAALALLFLRPLRRAALLAGPVLLVLAVAAGVSVGALYLTGAIDPKGLVLGNPVGSAIYEGLRAAGRGSFSWRLAQDLKTFPAIRDSLLFGTGQWDWFRPSATRPWGLPQLILGQFGIVAWALLALAGALTVRRLCARGPDTRPGMVLPGLLIAIAAMDSLLNSFLFYPAVTLAGACAVPGPRRQGGRPHRRSEETRKSEKTRRGRREGTRRRRAAPSPLP